MGHRPVGVTATMERKQEGREVETNIQLTVGVWMRSTGRPTRTPLADRRLVSGPPHLAEPDHHHQKPGSMSKEHTFTNGEVTIVWKPDVCIHSRKCWTGLGAVFQPGKKPWIKPEGATSRGHCRADQTVSERSVELSHEPWGSGAGARDNYNSCRRGTDAERPIDGEGPLHGATQRRSHRRTHTHHRVLSLRSFTNKPYCDGTHRTNGFTDAA